jgi:NAD(P)-dependent dehydrogenase (short-subunit alcohol dehydrogenase family)
MTAYNPFSLSGKTVLVTGASSGIGRATAVECAKLGATVVALGRDEARLQALKAEAGENIQTASLELTDTEEVTAFVKTLPALDGLVNAAGISTTDMFIALKPTKMQKVFDVNFFAPVEFTRLLFTNKKINRGASIVFLSSIDGPINSHLANSSYSATKSALAAIAKGMAVEFASKQIRVNYLMPGQTETPLIHSKYITDEQLELDKQRFPLKRYAKPEEIAYGAIYFLSDASAFTTGAGLVIDGGFTLL